MPIACVETLKDLRFFATHNLQEPLNTSHLSLERVPWLSDLEGSGQNKTGFWLALWIKRQIWTIPENFTRRIWATFFPRSRSIVGCDGTNFAWHYGTLVQGWAQQLQEQGCDYAMEKLTNRTDFDYEQGGSFLDVFDGSLAMCVKLTKDLEFDVFVRCQHDGYHWIKVGRVSWRSGPNLPQGKVWCPVIIFMPRKRMGQPRCAVTVTAKDRRSPRKGGAISKGRPTLKLTDRFADTPRLQVLDPTSDRFCEMPAFDSGGGMLVWEKLPPELCRLLGIEWKQFQVQSIGKVVLVEHKTDFQGALETHQLWNRHVTVSAIKLEDELKKRTKRLQHPCAACDGQVMANGPIDHLTSKAHWIELWKKIAGNTPQNMPSPEVGGPDGSQAAVGPKLGDPRRCFDFQPSDSSIETGTQWLGDGISGACVSGCFCGAV